MMKRNTLATKLLSIFTVLIILLSVFPACFAVELTETNIDLLTTEDEISPQIDETVWCFRQYNGLLQKRLWSYTEGKWLTEWITVGTVE